MRYTLCVDFDGVLHSYTSPWTGANAVVDPPVPGAFDWLLANMGQFDLQIYSSRSKSYDGILAMKNWFVEWAPKELSPNDCARLLGAIATSKISFAKEKPSAFLTIDDRAICFNGDWSKLSAEAMLAFKPWNKK